MVERKKRQRKPTIEEDTSNLPWQVISIILSKLPVKSLLRFRCVCKPWLSLISEPRFIKSHLTESIKSDRRRLLCSSYISECFHSIDCESSSSSSSSCIIQSEEIYFPIKKYREASFLCSCNGLVLKGLGYENRFVLWNPSTRTYKKFSSPFYISTCNTFYGICCDDSFIDDFKVVFISRRTPISNYYLVYTFKSNTWTHKRDFPYSALFWEASNWKFHSQLDNAAKPGDPAHQAGVAINGAPHWVVYVNRNHSDHIKHHYPSLDRPRQDDFRHDWTKNYVIVCFDFVEEKFKEVPLPYWMCEGDVFFSLTVISECLSLYITTNDFKVVEIWTMKEYGERNSWAKFISIPCEERPRSLCPQNSLCLAKKDGVVMLCKSQMKLVLYIINPKENKWRNLAASTGIRCFSSLVSYVDSLVSPSRHKLTKRQLQKRQGEGKGRES